MTARVLYVKKKGSHYDTAEIVVGYGVPDYKEPDAYEELPAEMREALKDWLERTG